MRGLCELNPIKAGKQTCYAYSLSEHDVYSAARTLLKIPASCRTSFLVVIARFMIQMQFFIGQAIRQALLAKSDVIA